MTDLVTWAASPDQAVELGPQLLPEMGQAATGRQHWKIGQHWKILLTPGLASPPMPTTCSSSVSRLADQWPTDALRKATLSSPALLTAAATALTSGRVADGSLAARSTASRC